MENNLVITINRIYHAAYEMKGDVQDIPPVNQTVINLHG